MLQNMNLTRELAQQRSALLTVHHYDIDIDFCSGARFTFPSITTIKFSADVSRSRETIIDLTAVRVISVILNGSLLDTSDYRSDQGLRLYDLEAENELIVNAVMEFSRTGEGLHLSVDPTDGNRYLYTQCEPSDADRFFACFDQPDLKATFSLRAHAQRGWEVISNTPVISRKTTNTGVEHRFATTERQSTYLVALIAGPYQKFTDEYTDQFGTIPLGIYVRRSLARYVDADNIFTETKQGFAYYHEKFTIPYPFGKYDQIFVPDFNNGAMENIGAVTFLEDYVFRGRVTDYRHERRCETILHEMAHMWFGNLVTMAWFDDLWLNESFATFISCLAQADATRYTQAWTTFAAVEKAWAYAQDQLSSTHPISADITDIHDVETNFDGITYAKGASVLKQLAAYVGIKEFLTGLITYFHVHAWGNATLADLLSALEQSSGRDLSTWGDQWLKTTGINSLQAKFTLDKKGNYASFTIEQGPATPSIAKTPAGSGKSGKAKKSGELRTHRIAVGIYNIISGSVVRTKRVEVDITEASTPIAKLIGTKAGEIVIPNDDDLTYAKVILDPATHTKVQEHIGDFTDPLASTLMWSALWEATRDGKWQARNFANLVIKHSYTIQNISVLEKVLSQAFQAINSYADPTWARKQGWPTFSDTLLYYAKASQPGSDAQLAYFQAFLRCPISIPGDFVLLRELLSQTDPAELGLPGLVVDQDIRWAIIIALVAHNEYPDKLMKEELQVDNTKTGRRFFYKGLGAQAVKGYKKAAWERLFTDKEISNLDKRWLAQGFIWPSHQELLAPYIDRYFTDVVTMWTDGTSREVAQTVTTLVFPYWASSEVLEAKITEINDLIASPIPSGLKRLLAEGRDEATRIVVNRKFDVSP